jgi:hypothetical protein
MNRTTFFLLGVVVSSLSQAACLKEIPSWDHQKLAHPTMTSEEMANGLDKHVRSVSEGAAGGLAGGGGGCGCN